VRHGEWPSRDVPMPLMVELELELPEKIGA